MDLPRETKKKNISVHQADRHLQQNYKRELRKHAKFSADVQIRSSFPAHLFVIGHASHSLPIPDVFRAMPEPEAVHLLRRPDLHLVVELSELFRWKSDDGTPDTDRGEAPTNTSLSVIKEAMVWFVCAGQHGPRIATGQSVRLLLLLLLSSSSSSCLHTKHSFRISARVTSSWHVPFHLTGTPSVATKANYVPKQASEFA